MDNKYVPVNLFFETYNCDVWFENKDSTNTTRKGDKKESVDLSDMQPLASDEERKEGEGLKILTPNNLLIRLLILLGQIKAANNSYKLKHEIGQILYLSYQHYKITKKVYNNLIKSL